MMKNLIQFYFIGSSRRETKREKERESASVQNNMRKNGKKVRKKNTEFSPQRRHLSSSHQLKISQVPGSSLSHSKSSKKKLYKKKFGG